MEFSVKSNVISLGDLKRKVSRVAQSCVKISICQIMRGEITFRLSLNSTNFVSFTFFIDFFFLKQLSLHTGTFHSWYFTVKHIIRPKSVKKKCTKSNKYLQTKYIFPSLDIIMLWLCTKSHLHEVYHNTASTNALKGVNNHDSCFFFSCPTPYRLTDCSNNFCHTNNSAFPSGDGSYRFPTVLLPLTVSQGYQRTPLNIRKFYFCTW